MAATIGVRQASPTSCILFIIYVNDLIASIRDNCGMDRFFEEVTHVDVNG